MQKVERFRVLDHSFLIYVVATSSYSIQEQLCEYECDECLKWCLISLLLGIVSSL
jgi:hypothetical protein